MTLTLILWLVIGALLIGGELMTGTFYLLIFGIAAWIGGALAFFGATLDVQLGVAGASAVLGLGVVAKYGSRWHGDTSPVNADLDIGNEVRVESVEGRRLRVMYRGAVWDAMAEGEDPLRAGDVAVIRSVRDGKLVVARAHG